MSFGRNLPQFTTRGITWISWRNLAVKQHYAKEGYHGNYFGWCSRVGELVHFLKIVPTMPRSRCKGGLCDLDVQLTPFQLVSYRTGLLQALAIRKSRMPSTGETKNNLQVRMQMVEGNPMVCESSAQLRTHPKEGGGLARATVSVQIDHESMKIALQIKAIRCVGWLLYPSFWKTCMAPCHNQLTSTGVRA